MSKFRWHNQGHMFKIHGTFLLERSGHLRKAYAKYEHPISNSKKVIADVQKYVKGHFQGRMFKIYGTIGKALS